MMLEGLGKLLEPSFAVVAKTTDGLELLEAAARLRPDFVITDVSMPGIDGIEATRRLATLSPATRVLILSFHSEASWVQAAFEAGAWGYLTKTAGAEEIEGAIREVRAGQFYVSPSVTRGFILHTRAEAQAAASPLPEPEEVLTPREQDVVRLVGRGLPNKEIASDLGVSVTTVRTHLNRVYDKLGRGNRVQLALYAAQCAGIAI
jgi:DNA-binding NarL/FixJ family response regulator